MITTDRLLITEFHEEMAECVHLNSLDEDSRKFVPDEVFETVEEAEETIRFLMGCYQGTEGPFVYPVLLKTGENIGYVQAVPIGDQWEIGYHIAAKYTRNGYASEAVMAFLPVIMERLGLEEIWAVCRQDNLASRRVLDKCSFELVSTETAQYHGQEHVICKYVYSLPKK
ncbi:MAG: GNAT family N-acetyltransferase [Bacillota bacterium]|jgi:ribosomal-protein-alanine N-acetyltransferase|nr:GNAT family N-acetyltransferase [Bacillota bacterium]